MREFIDKLFESFVEHTSSGRVWVNPSSMEMSIMLNKMPLMRGLATQNYLIVWDANAQSHNGMASILQSELGIDVSYPAHLMFVGSYGSWGETDWYHAQKYSSNGFEYSCVPAEALYWSPIQRIT